MAVRGDQRDSTPWKIVSFSGETIRDGKGKPLDNFNGYAAAKKATKQFGGVAVRK